MPDTAKPPSPESSLLERLFAIRAAGSTPGREILGGATTFMAMSYILVVQVVILSAVPGLNPGGVFMATCIASCIGCLLMGLLANYPVALAPGMGQNVFFVQICTGAAAAGMQLTWQEGLALTAAAGLIFLALSTIGFRSKVLNAIPPSLKSGIAAGIGLFICLIGFKFGGLIQANPATLLALADLKGNYVAASTLIGLAATAALAALGVRGAVLLGVAVAAVATWAAGAIWGFATLDFSELAQPEKWQVGGLGETAGGMLAGFGQLGQKLLAAETWLAVLATGFVLLFMDLFDTVGTLVGVADRAGLMRQGRLPRAERALAADAAATVAGASLGTSTVTAYIESATGVAAGARTGLAAVVAGLLLLAAMFAQPVVHILASGVQWQGGFYYPMIAPALIYVGSLMMQTMRAIDWEDLSEALPAFLAMVTIPFGYSISAGIAIGFVSFAFIKTVTGRWRECPVVVYVFAVLFAMEYAWAKVFLSGS